MNEPTRKEAGVEPPLTIGERSREIVMDRCPVCGEQKLAAWESCTSGVVIRTGVACGKCGSMWTEWTHPEMPHAPAESSPEPLAGPERGTGEAGTEKGAQAATLRDASVSIRTIADHMPGRHPEFVRGVRYVATLLGHTADDLTEGATP